MHLYLQLAELLGFSELDLIQQLLAHRQELVVAALDNTALLLKKGDPLSSYACSVWSIYKVMIVYNYTYT